MVVLSASHSMTCHRNHLCISVYAYMGHRLRRTELSAQVTGQFTVQRFGRTKNVRGFFDC